MAYFNLLLHSPVSNDGGRNIGPSQKFFCCCLKRLNVSCSEVSAFSSLLSNLLLHFRCGFLVSWGFSLSPWLSLSRVGQLELDSNTLEKTSKQRQLGETKL